MHLTSSRRFHSKIYARISDEFSEPATQSIATSCCVSSMSPISILSRVPFPSHSVGDRGGDVSGILSRVESSMSTCATSVSPSFESTCRVYLQAGGALRLCIRSRHQNQALGQTRLTQQQNNATKIEHRQITASFDHPVAGWICMICGGGGVGGISIEAEGILRDMAKVTKYASSTVNKQDNAMLYNLKRHLCELKC
jgi:hypothetical protein